MNNYKNTAFLKLILLLLLVFNTISCGKNHHSSNTLSRITSGISDQILSTKNFSFSSLRLSENSNENGKKIVAYFVSWGIYGRNYQVEDIPAERITHINYAFANIVNGGCASGDAYADFDINFPKLKNLKIKYPHLKILISVGGWTWSSNFSNVAATESGRDKFVQSCINYMLTNGFDGVDIDWEYPVNGGMDGNIHRSDDDINYVLLVEKFRNEFNKLTALNKNKNYLLTIAAPAGPQFTNNIMVSEMLKYIDWINVMTYDYHGGWDQITGHNSPLYTNPKETNTLLNGDAAINLYLQAGANASQLVLGIPFYGRGFSKVISSNSNDALFSSFTGVPNGTYEAGMFDYKDLYQNYINKNNYIRFFDSSSKVPYLFNTSNITNKILISYDDPDSVKLKAEYIITKGLAGAMIWSIDSDVKSDDSNISLLAATNSILGMPRIQNNATPTPSTSPISTPNATAIPTNTPTIDPTINPSPNITLNNDQNVVNLFQNINGQWQVLIKDSLNKNNLQLDFSLPSIWSNGYTAKLTLLNQSSINITNWNIQLKTENNEITNNIWNASLTKDANDTSINNLASVTWNSIISSSQSIEIGWNGNLPISSNSNYKIIPTMITINDISYNIVNNSVVIPMTPTPSPSFTPNPTSLPTPISTVDFKVNFSTINIWDAGAELEVTIINNNFLKDFHNWTLTFKLPYEITSIWNAQIANKNGDTYTIKGDNWNKDIVHNNQITFGLIIKKANKESITNPSQYQLLYSL
ncbi:MAG: cellulose binding domain-containing protein [Oligoflexia bacterium]|nr:cellulose binding domain-containing protein [Oligoflexia bacterium]